MGRFSAPMEGHGGIFLITILYVFVGLLPFSVFIPQAVHWSWQMRHNQQALLFCLTVAGVIVSFFCFSSTRLPNYTVPAYPFMAILVITYLLSVVKEHRSIRALRIPMVIYLVLAVLLPVGLFLALYLDLSLRPLAGWSVIFLAFPLGAGVAWYFYRRAALRPMVGAMACSFMATGLLFFGWLCPLIDRQNPVAQTLPVVRQAKQVVACKLFNPAFIFYIGHPILVYEQLDLLQKAVAQTPGLTVLSRAAYLSELTTVRSLQEVARQPDMFE